MTREEAIERIKEIKGRAWGYHIGGEVLGFMYDEFMEIMDAALSALRPVTRERIKQTWRGEWINLPYTEFFKNKCSQCGKGSDLESDFCPACGAPMTDEAVEMVMERLEALWDEKD